MKVEHFVIPARAASGVRLLQHSALGYPRAAQVSEEPLT